MKSGKLPISIEDERARLRRNQRNSRARKQAYVQDLEQRWNECVRLGVQATIEMQRESQKIQDENKLLRRLLHRQGLDDVAIEAAMVTLLAQESKAQPAHSPMCPIQTVDNHSGKQQSGAEELPQAEVPSDAQADAYQGLNIDEWLTDLCNIKDAFVSDVFDGDQHS
ncbi:hypothetical protein F5B22DRAFT_600677 [Xylaria bambusicola]|uniref:uncharacterized protein n=1 Tax=Xylaria bambusicola TaxID=326684 RepID=UPI002008C922|nr:uncharacterized protein F5B22DRAFT_600677 [Xylaria bambusicola]KAI0518295.1 hypothetical protein F5B22DRAFT_600677 [Xylaria bambusicola]